MKTIYIYIYIYIYINILFGDDISGKAWYGWPRLVGSLIVTVLLVIPWFFLAFSIVDDGSLNIDIPVNQGIYQVGLMMITDSEWLMFFELIPSRHL